MMPEITISEIDPYWLIPQPNEEGLYTCRNGHHWKRTTYSKMEFLEGCPTCQKEEPEDDKQPKLAFM